MKTTKRIKKGFQPYVKRKSPSCGRCFNCKTPVDSGDFCYGCNTFVCMDCWEPEILNPHAKHRKELHLLRIVQMPLGNKNITSVPFSSYLI